MKKRSLRNEDYDLIHSLVTYKDGEIYNKITGKKYGSTMQVGYVNTTLTVSGEYKIRDYNHRFIFLLHNGYLPEHVDHINRVKNDNRIENLRAATASLNCFNCKLSVNNKSGTNGVYFDKSRNKWVGKIKLNRKDIGMKRFETKEEAVSHRKYLEELYLSELNL